MERETLCPLKVYLPIVPLAVAENMEKKLEEPVRQKREINSLGKYDSPANFG